MARIMAEITDDFLLFTRFSLRHVVLHFPTIRFFMTRLLAILANNIAPLFISRLAVIVRLEFSRILLVMANGIDFGQVTIFVLVEQLDAFFNDKKAEDLEICLAKRNS